uniref:Uncharacterized protein n=1 Tax=Megaselia scalaris TaxID=36166 RepID=T1GFU2_MEGSC
MESRSQPFLLTPNKINQNIAKLQTTNDALLNLSTSPSGKLDPMVNLDSLSHNLNDSKAKENQKTNESLDNLSWKREREDELTLIVPTIKFDGDDTDLVENSSILEEVTPFLLTPNKINQNIAKLQTTNDALLNLSTSPSGKLDPMVNLDSLSHNLNDSKAKESQKTNESLDNLSWKREREDELTLMVPTIKFDGDDTDLVENSSILEEVTVTENEKTKVVAVSKSNHHSF